MTTTALRRACLLTAVLSSAGCYTTQHYRVPLAEGQRAAIQERLASRTVEVNLRGVDGVAARSLVLDADRVRWTRIDGVAEAAPLERVQAIRDPHAGRGVVYGGLGGLLLGGLAGSMIGYQIEDACIQRGHGDCGAPATTYGGMLLGALAGAVTLAIVGGLTASDTITFAR